MDNFQWFQVHWFIFLPDEVCCWTFLVKFSDQLLHSLTPKSVWFGKKIFFPCWNSHFVHALFSRAHWTALQQLFWIFTQVTYWPPFLSDWSLEIYCSFDWAVSPCFFVFLVILHWYLWIWKNSHLSHSLWNTFIHEKNLMSRASFWVWRPFETFLWMCFLYLCV